MGGRGQEGIWVVVVVAVAEEGHALRAAVGRVEHARHCETRAIRGPRTKDGLIWWSRGAPRTHAWKLAPSGDDHTRKQLPVELQTSELALPGSLADHPIGPRPPNYEVNLTANLINFEQLDTTQPFPQELKRSIGIKLGNVNECQENQALGNKEDENLTTSEFH
jgi:hypothetical protein